MEVHSGHTRRLLAPPKLGLLPTPHPSKLLYSDVVKTPPRQQPVSQVQRCRQQQQLQQPHQPPSTSISTVRRPNAHTTTTRQDQTTTETTSITRSNNPAFLDMVNGINITVRLLIAYGNWDSEFPWRLSKALRNFTDSVQPPRRSSAVDRRLAEATNKYKKTIHHIIINDIAISAIQQLENLRSIRASPSDWQLAADTATRQLRRSHKHIVPALLLPVINKVMLFIRDTSTTPDLLKRYFPHLVYYATNNPNPSNTTIHDSSEHIILSSTTTNAPSTPINNTNPNILIPAPAAERQITLTDIVLDSPDFEHRATSDTETDNDHAAVPTNTTHSSPIPTTSDRQPNSTPAPSGNVVLHPSPSAPHLQPAHSPTSRTSTSTTRPPLSQQSKLPTSNRRRLPAISTPAGTTCGHSQATLTPTAAATHPSLPASATPANTDNNIPTSRQLPTPTSSIPTSSSSTTASPTTAAVTTVSTTASAPAGAIVRRSSATSSSHSVIATDSTDNIRPFYSCRRNMWRIKPEPAKYTTLVIADSNGKRWVDAPDHWVIYSFSGMRLGDVANIMSRSMQLIQQYQKLIIHCGRNDTFRSVADNFETFVSYINTVTHPPITIVPSLVDPHQDEPGLTQLRQMISEEFSNNAVLFNQPQHFVRYRPPDLKHYHRSTARHLITAIIDHLN